LISSLDLLLSRLFGYSNQFLYSWFYSYLPLITTTATITTTKNQEEYKENLYNTNYTVCVYVCVVSLVPEDFASLHHHEQIEHIPIGNMDSINFDSLENEGVAF